MQVDLSGKQARNKRVDTNALERVVHRLVGQGRVPWLHTETARRMAERLPMIRLQPDVVLDWSGSLGASTDLLRAAYPAAKHLELQVEAFAGPHRRPDQQSPRGWWPWLRRPAARVQTVRMQDLAAGQADLLWSNMALQGCEDPPACFEQWHRAVKVGGFLMFATLGPGSLPELRAIYRQRGWGPAMLPFVDMHDLGDMLVHTGFAEPVMDQELVTLTWPDAEALLAELRGLGANVDPGRHRGLRTPNWRSQLLDALQASSQDMRPSLTFELVYGHAFRVAARPKLQSQTEVSLDAMREMVRGSRTAGPA